MTTKKTGTAKEVTSTEVGEWIGIGEATEVFGFGISKRVLRRLIMETETPVLNLNRNQIRIRRTDVLRLREERFGPMK